jgi:hypothetical protein
MVDATTVLVLATVVQTSVITLTLLVFIFQFRSQEKAIKESSYQNLMGRYNDFIVTMVGRPDGVKLILQQAADLKPAAEVTPEYATAYGNVLVAYGIIEEAFLLYQKGWIDAETWEQWAAWLRNLGKTPQIRHIQAVTKGTFDPRYEKFVAKVLAE